MDWAKWALELVTTTREGKKLVLVWLISSLVAWFAKRIPWIGSRSLLTRMLMVYPVAGSYAYGRALPDCMCELYDEGFANWLETWIKYYYQRFPAKIEVVGKLERGQQYIFASAPHGPLTLHPQYLHGVREKDWEAVAPRASRRLLGASFHYSIPIYRNFASSFGTVNATYNCAEQCLKRGYSIELVPGGEKEMLLSEFGKESVFVDHKGFVRLALKYGVPIVPIYAFGENSTYHTSSFLLSLRLKASQLFRIAVPFIYGDDPMLFMSPIKTPITIIVGDPILVPRRVENPTDQDINALHRKFVFALAKLFHKNKDRLGFGDKTLRVIGTLDLSKL